MKVAAAENQKGFVLVIVAFLLIVLVGFVALGVDTGALYSARTSAQEVADAAALAGAFTYINDPKAADPATTASTAALLVATNNSVLGKPIVAGDVTVTPDVAKQTVTVVVTSAQPTYFAKAIWGNSANISVTATAEAATNSTGSGCVKPWFIPNTMLTTATSSCAGCAAGEILIDPSTKKATTWGKSKIGGQFVVKPQSSGSALSPGDYFEIDLPDSQGGHDYEENIRTCTTAFVRCEDYYSVLTGKKTGPTMHGVDDLIGSPPRFTWISSDPPKYRRESDKAIFDISENVIVAPIWDTCAYPGFCPGDKFPSGTTPTVQVIGFAILFLEGTNGGGDVTARLVNFSACGDIGGTGPSGETGGTVLSFPLRLVRVP
jgi:Flp pilus assembly protein TadG